MLLVFGLVNATKQLIDQRGGNLFGKIPDTDLVHSSSTPFPVKFRYFHHGLLGRANAR